MTSEQNSTKPAPRGFWGGLRHAFAIETGPTEPTESQRAAVEKLCGEIVRRRMATPALMALEMSRPLNYVGAQVMHFFAPIVTVLFDKAAYNDLAEFLEHRSSIDYVCRRINALDEQRKEEKASGENTPS